jgi:hypothetical protein
MIDIYRDVAEHKIIWSSYGYNAIMIFLVGSLGFLGGARLFKQHKQVKNVKVKSNAYAANERSAILKALYIDKVAPNFVAKYEAKTREVVEGVRGHRGLISILIILGYIITALISYYSITLIYLGYGDKLWSTYYLELGISLGALTIGILLGIGGYFSKTSFLGTEFTPV